MASIRVPRRQSDLEDYAPPARGTVCFTWDDCFDEHHSLIASMADARAQRHTFGVVSDFIGQAGRLTSSQVLDLHNRGHEIANHSKSHAQVNGTGVQSLSTADRIAEYDTAHAAIEAIVGAGNCTTWIYPYGGRSAITDQELYLRYRRALGVTGNTSLHWIYPVEERNDFLIGRVSWDGTPGQQQQLLDAIRLAASAPVVVLVYAHDIDGGGGTVSTAQLTEAMNLCRTLRVPCLPVRDALPGVSLIRDPGFEDSTLASWPFAASAGSGSAASVVDAPLLGLNGSRSLRLRADTDASIVFVTQFVPVIPGQAYQFSGRYRSAITSGAGSVTAIIRERDYTGATVSQTATAALTATSWTQFVASRAIGNTGRMVRLELNITNLTADAYFDHLCFHKQALGALG